MNATEPPPRARIAAVTSALIIALQVAGKATRDSLFLTHFTPRALPYVMAAGAVLSFGGVLQLSRVMARRSPARVVPILFALGALGLFAAWAVGRAWPQLGAALVYLHIAFFAPVTLSAFWSLINERFDPHTAKRAVSGIAAGGTLGGVLGGLAAWRASTMMGPASLLPFLAGLSAAAALGTLAIRAGKGAPAATTEPPVSRPTASALATLRAMPFLRNLALLVAVGAASSAILDYVFSVQATATYGKGQPLLAFFSLFWLGVGVVSFALQTLLGRIALEKLGLAINVAVLPGVVILGGALGLAVPGLTSAAIMRGLEAVQRNTLFRSAYELLYAPLPDARKRVTKSLIDVGFDRVGTIAGSVVTLLAVAALPGRPAVLLLGTVVVLSLATLPVVHKLHIGYVDALQQSLRDAAASISAAVSDEAPPSSTNMAGWNREQLIERLEQWQPGGLSALRGPSAASEPPLPSPASALASLQELVGLEAGPLHAALAELDVSAIEVAALLPLLARPDVHRQVVKKLRTVAGAHLGQLIDAMIDRRVDFVVRRRIPQVMAGAPSQRAADGLLLGIADHRFEVRYAAGRALLRMTELDDSIEISREKVLEAVRREIRAERQTLGNAGADFDDHLHGHGHDSSLVTALIRDRVDRSLEHVFTVLSLLLDREPLRMAFRALHHEDSRFRGTALEYLDNVLPREVRDLVWPFLGETDPLPAARSVSDILAELERSAVPA